MTSSNHLSSTSLYKGRYSLLATPNPTASSCSVVMSATERDNPLSPNPAGVHESSYERPARQNSAALGDVVTRTACKCQQRQSREVDCKTGTGALR